MKRLNSIVTLCMLVTLHMQSQDIQIEPVIWRLTQLSGNVRLSATYNQGTNILLGSDDETKNSSLSAGVSLFTRSFVYHPNLLSLDISGGYEPGVQKYEAIVRPDFSSNSSRKFINARAHLMKRLDYNLQSFFNFDENYSNRENYALIKSKNKTFGSIFYWNNKILPFTVNYTNTEQDQLEVESNRGLVRTREIIETGTSKNYGERSQVSLTLNHTKNSNKVTNANNTSLFSSQVENATLYNSLNLAKNSNRVLRSRFNYYLYNTGLSEQERITLTNNFVAELPHNLDFNAMYNFYSQNFETQSETNHKFYNSITHSLYESLKSNFYVDYNIQNHSFFNQTQRSFSTTFNYIKKIPLNGKLRLNYTYRNTLTDREGEISVVPVFNETYYISDEQTNLIENSDVDITTLVVKDATGSLIYQEGIDYNLLQLSEFYEIQRIPGGLITNNSSVLIDYNFIQPDSYELANTAINYGIAVDFFTSTIQLFYNYSSKKYDDLTQMPYLKLDFYDRQRYGAKIKVKSITAGVEYDDFNSNLVPFKVLNYYANASGVLSQRFRYSVSFKKIDYLMLAEEGRTQNFDYANGNLFYYLSPVTNLSLDLAYQSQKTDALDVNWYTSRLTFKTIINQLELKAELNYYKKNFSGLNSNFAGASLQLTRKF